MRFHISLIWYEVTVFNLNVPNRVFLAHPTAFAHIPSSQFLRSRSLISDQLRTRLGDWFRVVQARVSDDAAIASKNSQLSCAENTQCSGRVTATKFTAFVENSSLVFSNLFFHAWYSTHLMSASADRGRRLGRRCIVAARVLADRRLLRRPTKVGQGLHVLHQGQEHSRARAVRLCVGGLCVA